MEEPITLKEVKRPHFKIEEESEDKVHFEKLKIKNVEIKIFLDRLIEIFNTVMTKLEFAALLPQVLSHPRVIEILSKDDLNQVVQAFAAPFCNDQCTNDSASSNYENWESFKLSHAKTEAENDHRNSNTSDSCPKTNVQIYNMLESLASYPLIVHLAHKYKDRISKSALSFIRQIEYFMSYTICRTKFTPTEQRHKELHLRWVFKSIEKANHDNTELNKALEEQKKSHRKELEELLDVVETLNEKLDQINDDFKEQHSKLLEDSENNLAASVENFNERLIELQASLEKTKESLEQQKAHNLKIETEVQGKKFKTESQLLAVLNKYDTEMSDRQIIYEDLQHQLADLEEEKSQLMGEMHVQLDFYNSIVTEREEKEFAVFKEKYDRFVRNRSAKIIQRWWREIWKKIRKLQKKGKKGKKKK